MSKQTDLLNLTDAISVSGSNVGIGTTSPTFTSAYGGLHVHSTYPEIHLTGTDSGSGAGDGFKIQKNSANNVYLWNYENALMAFGTNNSERMRLDSSGNLLVGKTDTTFNNDGIRLDPDGRLISTNTSNNALILNRTGTDGSIASFNKDGSTVGSIGTSGVDLTIGTNDVGLKFNDAANRLDPWNVNTNTAVDGTFDLGKNDRRFKDAHFSGTVNAANFNTTSDQTLKTNVETLSGSLDAVKSLRGVSFDWLENGGSEIGVIAQEVEAVLPDVVSTNDEGIKSVKYGNMVAVLIEAIKEQQAQIDELKAQLNS